MWADAAAIIIGLAFAFLAQGVVRPVPRWIVLDHLVLVLGSLPGFAVGAVGSHLYRARANERPSEEAANVARTVAIGVAWMVSLGFAFQFRDLSRLWVFLVATGTGGALLIERRFARRLFRRMRASGRLTRRIVIVGTDPHAVGMLHTYQRNPELGYEVVGFVGNDDIGPRGGVEVLGRLDELGRVLDEHGAVGVVVSLASVSQEEVNLLTRRLTDTGFHVALSSALNDIDITRLRPQSLDGRTLLYVEPIIRHGVRAVAKRVFDVVQASLILLVAAPVGLAATIAIKLDSSGPVFFRQQRVGRNGQLFTITKFRTMVVDAEERKADLLALSEVDGPLFKMAHDPRVTRVGRWLRKLSIDELPQLMSVLKGDMSMVGPRPALPEEVEQWDEALRERLRVLPGLTGLWQVSGRSGSTFEEYRRLDLYYVDNWSLLHDIRICAKTVGVVLTGRGAA